MVTFIILIGVSFTVMMSVILMILCRTYCCKATKSLDTVVPFDSKDKGDPKENYNILDNADSERSGRDITPINVLAVSESEDERELVPVDRKAVFIQKCRNAVETGEKIGDPDKMKQYMKIVETVMQIKFENEKPSCGLLPEIIQGGR